MRNAVSTASNIWALRGGTSIALGDIDACTIHLYQIPIHLYRKQSFALRGFVRAH